MYKNSKMFLRKNKVRLSALALRVECDIVGYCVIKSRRERRGREKKKTKIRNEVTIKIIAGIILLMTFRDQTRLNEQKKSVKFTLEKRTRAKKKNNYNNNTK